MGFTRLKYESPDVGVIFIDVNDNIVSLVGTPPTAAADSSLTAYHGVSRRRNGVHARGVILTRERGTAPNQFTSRRFLPVVSIADLADPAFAPGATITIAGTAWTVRRQVEELVN